MDDHRDLTEQAEQAVRWRKRAEEIRLMAEALDHPEAREDMLILARQWDLLAEHNESWSCGP